MTQRKSETHIPHIKWQTLVSNSLKKYTNIKFVVRDLKKMSARLLLFL
jgi:hypothetical protein